MAMSKDEEKNRKEVAKKETTEKTGSAKGIKPDEVKWVTVHGLHIPLGKGEYQGLNKDEAIKKALANAVDKQQDDIEKRQEEKDKLNEEMNSLWAKAPLLDKNGKYTSADLQRILNYLKKNPSLKAKFLSKLPKTANGRAIAEIVKSGNAGTFDKHGEEIIEAFTKSYKGLK